jgi:hypothetical protein
MLHTSSKKYLNKFIFITLIGCMSFLFTTNAWCGRDSVEVSKPSWKIKCEAIARNIRCIAGSVLASIDKNTILTYEHKPFAPGSYYFIQVKDPTEVMKEHEVCKGTIFFLPCSKEVGSAHTFLAECLLELKLEQLNSGGELIVGKEGKIKQWSVKTCAYHEVLGLDDESKDIPAVVGLPREIFDKVHKDEPKSKEEPKDKEDPKKEL